MSERRIIQIHVTSDFSKSFRKLPPQIQSLANKKDAIFRANAYTPALKTHKLKGALEGYWSYSVNSSYRILFRFVNHEEVIYYDIGTHEIYKF